MQFCLCAGAFKQGTCHVEKPRLKTGQRKEKDMEFLKEILGDDLFKQIEEKINAHNGNEANKEKQIKLANKPCGSRRRVLDFRGIMNFFMHFQQHRCWSAG